jgi:uncharacterized protein
MPFRAAMIPVKVKGVGLDLSRNPLLLLIDQEEKMVLPIGIGLSEAQVISFKLGGYFFPRPLTHDLITTVCGHLGAKITKIVVNDVQDGTYYAQIYLEQADIQIIVDARPSDGVALALASGTPLFVTEEVASHSLPFEEVVRESVEDFFDLTTRKWKKMRMMEMILTSMTLVGKRCTE